MLMTGVVLYHCLGLLSPFKGMLSLFLGALSPFKGTLSHFLGRLSLFKGILYHCLGLLSHYLGTLYHRLGTLSPSREFYNTIVCGWWFLRGRVGTFGTVGALWNGGW